MRVKIRGGTVNGGEPPLCQTCRYATIVRGPSLRDEIVECQELMFRRGRITFPVTYCTSYSDRRQPSVREMEEITWILRSDPAEGDRVRPRIEAARARAVQPNRGLEWTVLVTCEAYYGARARIARREERAYRAYVN